MFKRFLSVCVAALAVAILATDLPATAAMPAQARCAGRLGKTQDCPIPLRFTRGSYGVMVNGVFTREPDTRYYSVAARAGQLMTLSFHGAGPMRGGVTFPRSGGDGPFNGQGDTIRLPRNGVYIVYVGQNTMAGNPWRGGYTLSVMVR